MWIFHGGYFFRMTRRFAFSLTNSQPVPAGSDCYTLSLSLSLVLLCRLCHLVHLLPREPEDRDGWVLYESTNWLLPILSVCLTHLEALLCHSVFETDVPTLIACWLFRASRRSKQDVEAIGRAISLVQHLSYCFAQPAVHRGGVGRENASRSDSYIVAACGNRCERYQFGLRT